AADVDSSALSARIIAGPVHGSLTVNADGSFSYQGSKDYFGSDSFTYRINDGELNSEVATVSLSITAVNDAPVAADVAVTTLEDTATIIRLIASDVDSAAAQLQFSIQSQPAHGKLARNADGSYSYTPVANYNGADSFTYTVTDGALVSNLATVQIAVAAVNDAPVAQDLAATLAEDGFVVLDIAALASDADGDALNLSVGAAQSGSLIRQADGRYRYTPAANFNGSDSFTYTASDGAATAIGTIRLTITAVNDVPVFTSTPPTRIALGTPAASDSVFLPTNQAGSITANFKLTGRQSTQASEAGYFRVDDAMGRIGNLRPGDVGYAQAALDPLRAITLFNGSAKDGSKAAATLAAGQHVGFYLIQNASLSAWRAQNSANALGKAPLAFFSFQAANPDGLDHLQGSFASGNGNGQLTLQWEDLVFTATGFKSVQTSSAAFTYDANATDVDGDALTYSLGSAPAWASIDSQTGLIRWTATATGDYSFSVIASDGKGGTAMQTFTLTVLGFSVNTAPVARADSVTLDEDTSATFSVLANDTDADGDTLTALLSTAPAHGTLVKNANGSFSYTPDKDWFGTDSFTYVTTDGKATSAPATVTLTVKPVNDAPVAGNASYTVRKDGSLKIDLLGLSSDIDGDCLTVTITNPGKGTLTRNQDGSYTYKPSKGYTGADSFSYTVSDGKLAATGLISLSVRATQGGDDEDGDRSASIIVTSSASADNTRHEGAEQEIRYVVLNSAATAAAPDHDGTSSPLAVNWQGSAASCLTAEAGCNSGSQWLSELLGGSSKDDEDLASKTGLRIKL
ncbi:MAG: tandem-95 repeat protein, partial [Polaromonas sp.]|nr:tandem-95 repeat protein [Polaromonas sp.]